VTAVDEHPVEQLVCVKGTPSVPCTGRPVVRYAVGPVCSEHLLPGAEVYRWLTDPASLADVDLSHVVDVLERVAFAPLGPPRCPIRAGRRPRSTPTPPRVRPTLPGWSPTRPGRPAPACSST
jgi:hypothetical protein